MAERVGGQIFVAVNGSRLWAIGSFTCNPGIEMKEGKVGADEPHGPTVKPQLPFLEGAIRLRKDLDLEEWLRIEDATVTVELANGRVFTLFEAWNASSGSFTTEEHEVEMKFEGVRASLD